MAAGPKTEGIKYYVSETVKQCQTGAAGKFSDFPAAPFGAQLELFLKIK
jgi:hypothetical protein